jgi:hypothetical protein
VSGDGGWDGGDIFLGFLLGALFTGDPQQPKQTGHHHGEHWHTHVLPPGGRHRHDDHLDGPIRVIPPTVAELAAQQAHRAAVREGWAALLCLLGITFLLASAWRFAMLLLAAAFCLSAETRTATHRLVEAAWQGCRRHRPQPTEQGAATGGRGRAGTALTLPSNPFVASNVEVGADAAGQLRVEVEGRSQVTARELHVTVVVRKGGRIVGEAGGSMHDLEAGQPARLVLHGRDRYVGYDRLEVTSRLVSR